jgi:hypothetical protein
MIKITCSTTLNNYGWREGWYVDDGGKMKKISKLKRNAKLKWIQQQGISSACVETVGGWSFKHKQDAIQFVLTWS